jgi:cytochrome P450
MAWWMLAMVAYPETQARAHAELDAIVGRGRVPTFADYPHLPYVRAMVKEVLRWRPATPFAVPHQTTEDDWYEGMFIQKGTICIPNVWQMNHDPEIYGASAEMFDPARYLDNAAGEVFESDANLKDDGHVTYGFGRRVCIGRYMANNSLFIEIATMLWAANIERKTDASGRPLPLDVDGFEDHGLVMFADFTIVSRAHESMADFVAMPFADVRCLSSARSLRASRKLMPSLYKNASCGVCEHRRRTQVN